MTYKIEKGIPIVDGLRRGKYPFREMEVGDSIFVSAADGGDPRQSAYVHGKKYGKKFRGTLAIEGGVPGCRIWRVE